MAMVGLAWVILFADWVGWQGVVVNFRDARDVVSWIGL